MGPGNPEPLQLNGLVGICSPSPRSLPHGQGVAVPQLAVDFAQAGGRGPEQAEFLLERYAAALPYTGEAP